jgi:nucleotide-binding universal stress UspA family protein
MTMVLVPLDGTRVAERAVPLARSLAAWSGAELLLVRSAWDCSTREVTVYLDDVVDRFDLHREASARVVDAYPADAVSELARGQEDAVLVLATHGRSGLGHALIGSFGEEILARWPGPALVVGPHPGAGRRGVPGAAAAAAGPSATPAGNAPGGRGRLGWCSTPPPT